jgi:hypothetical protein
MSISASAPAVFTTTLLTFTSTVTLPKMHRRAP